ncbi:MAG TPA: MFS transporter [Chlamydiales bacterium]|nr:MFS transporter [Chlamydiales bacterium]
MELIKNEKRSIKKGWIVTLAGALFFFYAFVQANMMTALSPYLQKAFGATVQDMGFLSGCFFYSNVIFLIPAGLILDRVSIKKIFFFNLLIAAFGTLLFAMTTSLYIAAFSRFLSGIMMAFGLIACLKLASLVLPARFMGLASSLIVMIGMFGGVFSQAPLALVIEKMGWKGAVLVLSSIGFILSFVLWAVISLTKVEESLEKMDQKISIFKSLSMAFKEKQNWMAGLFISLLNFPVAILGALFGITYLMNSFNVEYITAASIVSMLFLGMLIGSPVFGLISDKMGKRRFPMLIGSVFCLIFVMMVLYSSITSIAVLHMLFFLIGFTSASQALGYPIISMSNPPHVTGVALSLGAILIMGLGYGFGLPFVGFLIEKWGAGQAAYHHAFQIMPIGIVLAMSMVLGLKEYKMELQSS